MNSGIYLITCISNGHFYIGRTIDFKKRTNDHLRDLRNNKHKNPRMQLVFNKYGEESFRFEIIRPILPKEEFHISEEQKLINKYIDDEKCMNINRTAGGGCIVPTSEAKREKLRARTGEKHHCYGTKRPQSFKDMVSRIHKGKKLNEETRRKLSEAHKGKKLSQKEIERLKKDNAGEGNPMYGRRGKLNPNSKAILQIDKDTNKVIKEFAGIREAGRELNVDYSTIGKVCRGKGLTAYGYKWKFKD